MTALTIEPTITALHSSLAMTAVGWARRSAHAVCSRRSLRLHAGSPYHRRPLVALLGEEGRELLRRGDPGVDTEFGERVADLGRFQAFVDRGVELGHDRRRCARGRHHRR